jgi:hypothetical protein
MPVNPTPQSTIHGYVFDGLFFVRACADRNMQVIGKDTRVPTGTDPATMVWYTRREFQNAIAWCQARGTLPKDLDLNMVAPVAPLLARLKDQASLRKTEDHILHMLTAGKGPLTPTQLLGYQKMAGDWTRRMVEAYKKSAAGQVQIA